MFQPGQPIALAAEVPHLHPKGINWVIFARCIKRAMRHTHWWGYFNGSNMRPIFKDPDHPMDVEELAAQQWDCKDKMASYLMSQYLPNLVILDIRDFTTTWEQWDAISSIFTAKTEYAITDLHQSFLDIKCPRGGDI
jgi:hypothetical protein